jgi:ATPase subunit of ABC transporter with duplicated ATPase domains
VRERKETQIERAEEEIARKRAFVDRFGAKATKASQAQSRLRQIEKIEVEELVASSRRTPVLRFEPERPSGREVLEIEGLAKSYGEKRVLTNVSMTIRRGERVAIIGPNGLGKSTMLKIVADGLPADAGKVKWGHETRVGYFPQDHREVLHDPDTTPLETLWAAYPGQTITFVRTRLGHALFSGAEVEKRIGALSGGENARLIFALIAAQKPNVLVLDEPTNHLDIEAIEALVEALKTYVGTVLFVSHDRWFVSELATRIIELRPEGPRDFAGSYAEYVAKCGDDHLDADAVAQRARKASREAREAGDDTNRDDWAETKRKRNRINKLPGERDRVLAAIEKAETRGREIEALYCTPGFFETTAKDVVETLEKEKAALGPQVEKLMAEWEAIESEMAAAKSEAGG